MIVSTLLLFLFSWFQAVTCTGKLSLKLVSYSNPSSRLYDGSCCDGVSCGNQCDNYFIICLTRPSSSRCALGHKETSVLGDDSFNFGGSLGGGTSNPVVYGFQKWEGSFALTIEVKDEDGGIFGKDDYVDRIDKNWVVTAKQKQSLATAESATLRGRVSVLKVEIRVYCDDKYLLPSCEEYCVYTDSNDGHYSCDYVNGKKICIDGWYGPKCLQKRKDCTPRDDDGGHYKCDPITGDIICLSGWKNEKTKCIEEINECLSNPCVNGGICSDLIDDYNCSCKAGYDGKRCEKDINECLSSPCIYGTCNDLLNNYTCDCRQGFFGVHCEQEIDECLSSPCVNGICINAVNAYKCQCRQGFSGISCEFEIDECQSNPCMNNATCSDLIDAYKCTCMPGFTGRHCDTNIQDILKSSSVIKATSSNAINGQNQQTSTITLKSSMSHLPDRSILSSESRSTGTEAADPLSRIQATTTRPRLLMTSEYLQVSKSILQSQYGNLISNLPMSTPNGPATTSRVSTRSCFTISSSGEKMCGVKKSRFEYSTPSYMTESTISASLSEGTISTKIHRNGKMQHEIKIVTYEIEMHGDVKKWSTDSSATCDRAICESVKDGCSERRIGCGYFENQSDKDSSSQLKLVKVLQNESLVVVTKEFEVNLTKRNDENSTLSCIEQAILGSADKIEKQSSFRILKLNLIKITAKNNTKSNADSFHSTSVIHSRGIPLSTKMPAKKPLSVKADQSKLLAIVIVCNILGITLILLIVHWRRRQRSLKRVTPLSTKRLYNNNNDIQATHTENVQQKILMKTEKHSEIKIVRPRATTLDKSKGDQASLLEREANQLETFFL